MGVTTLVPAFSEAREFGEDPLTFLRQRVGQQDAVILHLGLTKFVFVASPALIKHVLVTGDASFGEGKWTQRGQHYLGDCIITREGAAHAERRRLIQPAFRQFDDEQHKAQMKEAIAQYTESWRDGDVLEMRREMGRLALAIACTFLFGEDPQENHPGLFEDLWQINSALSSLPRPGRPTDPALTRIRLAARGLRNGVAVRQFREADLAEEDIDREIIALMIASIDTTPGALSWIWTELSQHPEIEKALCRELRDRSPEPSNILRNVVAEVLRLHPPVRFVDRRALVNMKLGDVEVRAGDYVLMSPFLNHRDRHYWDAPDSFRPERWSDGGRASVDRFMYFPFGAGPHACIGGALAQREIDQVVTALLPRWRFKTVGTPPDPRLVPPHFEMRIESR